MIIYKTYAPEYHVLTPVGQTVARNGSHEFLFWSALSSTSPMRVAELEAVLGKEVAKLGQGRAMRNKWARKEGDGFIRAVESVVDTTQIEVLEVEKTGDHSDGEVLSDLKKRKLAEKKCVLSHLSR